MLLAVIGPRWLCVSDPATGRRRIDDPSDWIRRELAEAFAAGVRVVPILTDQADLPGEADLPADIAALGRCQYRYLRRRESTADLARIVADLTALDPVLAAAARRHHLAPHPGHPSALRPIVTLPHRAGTVPPRAAGFQTRATTDYLATALEHGTTAVLTSDSATRTGVVAGMGGVGKTQIALDYAERLWSTGDVALLVWVTAGSRDAIVSTYADLAADLTGITDPEPERGARRLLEVLATLPGRWLVVLDDVQNPADLRGLWPPDTPTGRIVVTTRRRDAALRGQHRTLIEVDVFTPEEAHAYLDTVLAEHPHLRHGVQQLAAALGYLPLALAQASAYLVDRDLSCADYLTRWVDRRQTVARLVPEPDVLPDEYRATVAATWSLSVEQANGLEPAGVARPLLEVASFLDANGMPASLFTAPAVVEFVAATTGREVSADEVRDGLGCLRRLSLLTVDSDSSARAVRVHALVQRATRDTLPANRLPVVVRVAADALLHVWPWVEWPRTERDAVLGGVLRANATAVTETGAEHLWTPDAHGVWFRAGRSLGEAGLAVEAREYFQRLHAAAVGRVGPDHPATLTTRRHLAYWLGESGDAIGAAAAFEELLTDTVRVLGSDHATTLAMRHHLARWRGESGDAVGAVAAYQQLLTDTVRVLGSDHPSTLKTRRNLAYWRGESGDVVGAAAAFEELLTDMVHVLGPYHLHTLTTRGYVAHWQGESGDVVGAAAAFEELVTDARRVLGPDHPNTPAMRHHLARWRTGSGDAVGAEAAFEALVSDVLRVLGPAASPRPPAATSPTGGQSLAMMRSERRPCTRS